jgi:hypothetical protein
MPLATMRTSLEAIRRACDEAGKAGGVEVLARIAAIADEALSASTFDTKNRIARIIDPEVHERYDAVRHLETPESLPGQMDLLPRLLTSMEKADLVIASCLAADVKQIAPGTSLYAVIANIREKSGLGARPMLGELADAIRKRIDDAALAFPAAVSDEDIERTAIAWTWSYANAVHDHYQPGDTRKDSDGLTTPEKLWDAMGKKEKEFARLHIRTALAALVAGNAPSNGFVSEDAMIQAVMTRIGDLLNCFGEINAAVLPGIEIAIRGNMSADAAPQPTEATFERALDIVLSASTADQNRAVTTIASRIGRSLTKTPIQEAGTGIVDPQDAALLLKFANAFVSGAQGAQMDFDAAQGLSNSILRLLVAVRHSKPDATRTEEPAK